MKTNRRTIVCSWLVALALAVSLIPYIPDTDVYAETLPEEPQSIQTAPDFLEPVESLTEVPDGFTGIYTTADLDLVRNGLTMNYILMNDISFTEADFAIGGDFYNGGLGFLPIGSDSTLSFQGVFNGNGHIISGMTQQVPSATATIRLGLFGYASNAEIYNLGLTECQISAQTSASGAGIVAGGIVGVDFGSTIDNCFFAGDISVSSNGPSWGSAVGGIVASGVVSQISHCLNMADLSAINVTTKSYIKIGGIAGGMTGSTTIATDAITDSYNLGNITAQNTSINDQPYGISAGGIIGFCDTGLSMERCGNSGFLDIKNLGSGDLYAGGIMGGAAADSIVDCFNSGYLRLATNKNSADIWGGGILGSVASNNLASCYNVGQIGAYNSYQGSVAICYTGGIAGSFSGNATNCYYLENLSSGEGDESILGMKLSETQMTEVVSYEGFDFDNTWEINNNLDYPFPTLKGSITWPAMEQNWTDFNGGYGTSEHPFLVATAAQLNNVRMYLDSHIQLSNTIEFSSADFAASGPYYGDGKGFLPIGENKLHKGFSGTFDGNGYAVVGLYQNRSATSDSIFQCGLFGLMEGGTIKNLGMVDFDFKSFSSNSAAGGLVGIMQGNSLITGSYATGKVSGAQCTGGIVGLMQDSSQITDCFSTADVYSYNAAGGIAGHIAIGSAAVLETCYEAATIKGEIYQGAIVGYSGGATYLNCHFSTNTIKGIGQGSGSVHLIVLENMKLQSSFTGFDFNQEWTIGNQANYPFPTLNINKYPLKFYYTVTFDNQNQYYMANQKVAYHEKVAEPAIPIWTGHSFGGWSAYSTFSPLWNFEQDVVEGPLYLYAKWTTNSYTVSFDAVGGSSVQPYTGVYNTLLPEPNPPTKPGYTFGGWFRETQYNNPWYFSYQRIYDHMVLYAKWIPNTYAIKYNANGATSGTMANTSMTFGATKTLAANTFKKNGYVFLGWAKSATGDVAYKDKAAVMNLSSANGTTVNLYAKWGAPLLSAKSYSYTSIKVSWAAAGNATSYRIYRATSATGTYSYVYTAPSTALFWVNTRLTTGKTYYFKVYPVAGGKTIAHSTYKYAKVVPATPSVSLSKYSSTSIKVSWIGVSGATKYQIFRATSATGTYTYLYTASPTIRSWVNTGLTRGKTYYYKVRAYHLEGTTKVYGATSAVKYLKL